MGLARELADLWRFHFGTVPADRAITFYSEHESYYAYFEGLVDALKARRQTPLCYVTSDPDDPILTAADPDIHVFHFQRLLPFFMRTVNCRVLVMTLTDLDQFHLRRSFHPVHYVYAFHAMHSVHMAYRFGAFDHYDSILCTGPYQVQELRRDSEVRQIRNRRLVEGGYSRLERIHAAWKLREPRRESGRRTVLIAPSWSASNVLETHGNALVRALLTSDLAVIVRPHPETQKRTPELTSRLESMFSSDVRFQLERSVRTDDSLLSADVLITDWSGIALEYAFGTERPVLYIEAPRKVHNDRYTELGIEPFEVKMREELGVVVRLSDLAGVAEVAVELIRQRDHYRQRIVKLRSENVFNFGRSGEVGAQHIRELLEDSSTNE